MTEDVKKEEEGIFPHFICTMINADTSSRVFLQSNNGIILHCTQYTHSHEVGEGREQFCGCGECHVFYYVKPLQSEVLHSGCIEMVCIYSWSIHISFLPCRVVWCSLSVDFRIRTGLR